jgi:hypothetical protein
MLGQPIGRGRRAGVVGEGIANAGDIGGTEIGGG